MILEGRGREEISGENQRNIKYSFCNLESHACSSQNLFSCILLEHFFSFWERLELELLQDNYESIMNQKINLWNQPVILEASSRHLQEEIEIL